MYTPSKKSSGGAHRGVGVAMGWQSQFRRWRGASVAGGVRGEVLHQGEMKG
jgi:hypothetical protein